MVLKNANVFLPTGTFAVCDVKFSDRIEAVGQFPSADGEDASGLYLVPGLIDVHTHGAMCCDFSDGNADDLPVMAKHYAAHGVTSFLATTMTLPEEQLVRAGRAVASYARGADMARCMGMHMEGPFLSYAKRGAQRGDYIHVPSVPFFRHVNDAAGGRVRLVAVAPETEGAIPFIEAVSGGCAVSVAHTAADYDTAVHAFEAGATQATHLFNGMPPIHHRDPGPILAAMDSGAWAELICDGKHVHPAAIRAAFRMFPDRIVLVSDSLRCAGMPEGEYELGGQQVTMKDNLCRLADGTIAGSVITVLDALRNVVSFGIPLETAVAAAAPHPARAVGIYGEVGSIEAGKAADMLLLDGDLALRRVYIGGTAL